MRNAWHRGSPGSTPFQTMWDYWWTKRQWDGLFSEYFRFPLTVLFN